MAPHPWMSRRRGGAPPDARARNARGDWHTVGALRRTLLAAVVGVQTYLTTNFMVSVLPYHGSQLLEVLVLILFAVLCLWVSSGFWMAVMGFVLLLSGRDRYAISGNLERRKAIDPQARTAIVPPGRRKPDTWRGCSPG